MNQKFLENKNENKNEFISLCSAISAHSSANGPRPTAAAVFLRTPPRPGRNLGLGREFGLARAPV